MQQVQMPSKKRKVTLPSVQISYPAVSDVHFYVWYMEVCSCVLSCVMYESAAVSCKESHADVWSCALIWWGALTAVAVVASIPTIDPVLKFAYSSRKTLEPKLTTYGKKSGPVGNGLTQAKFMISRLVLRLLPLTES